MDDRHGGATLMTSRGEFLLECESREISDGAVYTGIKSSATTDRFKELIRINREAYGDAMTQTDAQFAK